MFRSLQEQFEAAYIKLFVDLFPRDFILYTLTILHSSENEKTIKLNVSRKLFDIKDYAQIQVR